MKTAKKLGTVLPNMPDPAPTIEVFPGVHATLIGDWHRFSNGAFIMTVAEVKATHVVDGKRVQAGEMLTSVDGSWYVKVGESLYDLPMSAVFTAFFDAHSASMLPTSKVAVCISPLPCCL